MFSAVNVDNVDIGSDFKFRGGRLQVANPTNTFEYKFENSAITGDRNVVLPLLTAADTFAFQAHPQPLTQKTIDVISNTVASRAWTVLMVKVGSTYYAIKYDGTILSSSTTAETVIAAALTNKGIIYFAHTGLDTADLTLWDLSGAFTGFTINNSTTIIADSATVRIRVPNGFTGTCFLITGSTDDQPASTVNMKGIRVGEQGTSANNWTGIKLQMDSTDYMSFSLFQDIQLDDCNIGIELETSNSRFINSNRFDNVLVFGPRIGFLFDQQSGEISENLFTNCIVQGTSVTTNGFKDIDGTGNMFIGCTVWDPEDSAIEANIKSTADGITIIGGRMSGGKGHFIDEGHKTLVMDTGNTITTRVHLNPDAAKDGSWYGSSATNGSGVLGGNITNIATGSASGATAIDSTGVYRTYDTGATVNSLMGTQTSILFTNRILNAYFKCALYLNSVSNVRVFAGLVASASAPVSSSDPLNALEGVGLWLDSAVSSSWKRMHNDTSGVSTVDNTAVVAATSTLYPVEIYAVANTKFRFVFNGVSTDISSNIPGSTTGLAYRVYIENTTGASRTIRNYYIIVRTDK